MNIIIWLINLTILHELGGSGCDRARNGYRCRRLYGQECEGHA